VRNWWGEAPERRNSFDGVARVRLPDSFWLRHNARRAAANALGLAGASPPYQRRIVFRGRA
jgi:hypothetical protein